MPKHIGDSLVLCSRCSNRVRAKSVYHKLRCENGHETTLHRACLKPVLKQACPISGCTAPYDTLDQVKGSPALKSKLTQLRNKKLAKQLYDEFSSGYTVPITVLPVGTKSAHVSSIKEKLHRFNFYGDRWSGEAGYRRPPERLEAFCAAIKMA